MATVPVEQTIDALVSHALTLGRFERVNRHEPTHTPGTGMTAAFWAGTIRPVARASGLAVTSAQVVYNARTYMPVEHVTPDYLDPAMTAAIDELMSAYTGDFTVGGNAMNIDVMNMIAEAGYLQYDEGASPLRVYTITIPVIYADVWTQAP